MDVFSCPTASVLLWVTEFFFLSRMNPSLPVGAVSYTAPKAPPMKWTCDSPGPWDENVTQEGPRAHLGEVWLVNIFPVEYLFVFNSQTSQSICQPMCTYFHNKQIINKKISKMYNFQWWRVLLNKWYRFGGDTIWHEVPWRSLWSGIKVQTWRRWPRKALKEPFPVEGTTGVQFQERTSLGCSKISSETSWGNVVRPKNEEVHQELRHDRYFKMLLGPCKVTEAGGGRGVYLSKRVAGSIAHF